MNTDKLIKNESIRLNLSWLMLLCFAVPSPVNIALPSYFTSPLEGYAGGGMIQLIAESWSIRLLASYTILFLILIFLPKYIVRIARGAVICGLVAALVMFLPLNSSAMVLAYLLQAFSDIFLLILEIAVIVNLFSKESAIKALCLVYTSDNLLLLGLNNGIIPMSFTLFKVYMVVASLCWLYLYFKLPAKSWPQYVRKADQIVRPRMLSIALYLLIALGGVITLFGSHIAEQILKQRSILAIAYAITFIAVYILWKRIGIDPFKIGSILASIGTLGFMGMVLSIYIPSLATISIIFIGVGTATFAINVTYGGIVLMRRYPSRFTVPIMVIIAFTLVLIHALLLNALQDNLPFLYAIYLFFSIVLTILYLMLYPYLSYTMHEKTRTEPIIPSEKTESLNEHSFDKLSGQELRLAELIMQGYTNSEMAEVLNITENTVKGYRKTLYSKLQIHSRKELFALAER